MITTESGIVDFMAPNGPDRRNKPSRQVGDEGPTSFGQAFTTVFRCYSVAQRDTEVVFWLSGFVALAHQAFKKHLAKKTLRHPFDKMGCQSSFDTV
jgi:hypothetical protein